MDFQKYNIKEKKQKEKGRKKRITRIIKKQKTKQNKKPTTTIQRLYMVFALKKKKSLFFNSNSRLQK